MDFIFDPQPSKYQQQIQKLEEIELRDQDETSDDVYKQLLTYYLIDDQPMKAKFLWKRIPSNLKVEHSELNRLWSLIEFFINRKYAQAFSIANQYKSANQNWSNADLNTLVELLIEKSRERLFDLVNIAYSSINIQELATNLGLSQEETSRIALSQGWSLDDTKIYLIPKKKQNNEIVEIPNQTQMQQLTSLVSFLET